MQIWVGSNCLLGLEKPYLPIVEGSMGTLKRYFLFFNVNFSIFIGNSGSKIILFFIMLLSTLQIACAAL